MASVFCTYVRMYSYSTNIYLCIIQTVLYAIVHVYVYNYTTLLMYSACAQLCEYILYNSLLIIGHRMMEIYKSKCSVSSFHRDCKAHKSDYSISKYRLTINCMRNYTCTRSPYSQLSLTLRSSMFPEMDKVGNCILEGPLAIRCAPSNSANIGDKMSSLSTPESFHLHTSLTLD